MLLSQIKSHLTQALKDGATRRLETLRFLVAAIQNASIAKYGAAAETSLTDDDVLEVLKKQVKSHRESIDAFAKAGRADLTKKEEEELTILEAYLPLQLSDEEIKKLLAPVIASGETNPSTGSTSSLRASSGQVFGTLMGAAMAVVKGQADGGRVAAILKQMLQRK